MIRNTLILSVILSLCALGVFASTKSGTRFNVTGSNFALEETAIATPTPTPEPVKRIDVSLSQQTLSYYSDDTLINTIKISSGIPALPTPMGTFYVLEKIPSKEYFGHNLDGSIYDFKNTLWNLKFSDLGYYIHGAYWHNNFGHPMSHGCVNVSYTDMPQLYAFADVGTMITIHQ